MKLIDMDALFKKFENIGWYDNADRDIAEDIILDFPTVDAEPVKHGHWVFGSTLGHSWMKCSECCVSQSGQTLCFTYCPNCGARMDLPVEHEGE